VCSGKINQKWSIYKRANDAFKFVGSYSNRCLDGWGMGSAARLKQYDCDTGTQVNQEVGYSASSSEDGLLVAFWI
jgi:hypothetical protein